jgi:hypothetical protein
MQTRGRIPKGSALDYTPTRERFSLVRLSIVLSGNYCTVDLVASISLVNHTSTNDVDAGTDMRKADESSEFSDCLRGYMHSQ